MTHVAEIKTLITSYEQKYARKPNSVRLLAVSKKQPLEKMLAAIAEGQRCFGESYVQEALEKMEHITAPNIEWHFIGPIQSNKTRKIAEHFAWVHSVDDVKFAKRLNDQRPDHLPPLNICIEVNVSHEVTKSGVERSEVLALAKACQLLPKLKLRGLMTIPAATEDFVQQRAAFHQLHELFDELQKQGIKLDTLSMGMSEDFEAAIAEGATIVRIGTGVFGKRE
jgi:PLP dependent protein